MPMTTMTAEHIRLKEAHKQSVPWLMWGPYLSERQWGTVREDYSEGGNAWDYFSHDHARSRAYRWGEDGLAGICDERQRLCFALSMWNGKDPILKERLFGLTNAEGNHGEDVKEYYFYLDSTPDALVHALPVQVPAGRLSVRRPGSHQPHAGPQSVRVRADRHRRVRPGPLLRRVRRVRQGLARGYPDPLHGSQPRAGRRHPRPAAEAVVPQRVVLACRREAPDARAGRGSPRPVRRPGRPPAAGHALPLLRGGRPAAVHRERDEHAADLRRHRTSRPTSRTGSTTPSSTAATTR